MKKFLKKYYKDIIIFLIPLVLMGIVLCIFYPGVMTYDSYNQLNQIIDNVYTRGHPFLHTIFEFILYKPFKLIVMIPIAQIVIFSTIWTYICNYLRKIVPNNKFFIFQIILTIIFSINPMNALFTISLWKDILYSYLMLLLTFLLFRLFYEKDITNKKIIIFTIVLSLVPNIRYNGISVFIGVLFIVLLLFVIKKIHWKKILLFFGMSIIVFNLLKLPERIVLKDDSMEASNMSFIHKEMQLLGHFHLNNKIEFLDEFKLKRYINFEELEFRFNKYWTDNLAYMQVDKDKYNKNHKELINILVKTSFNHPISFIKCVGNSTTILWKLKQPDDVIGFIVTPGYDSRNNYHHIKQVNIDKPIYNKYVDFVIDTLKKDVTNVLMYSPALMLYIAIISAIIVGFITKNKIIFVSLLPIIFNSLGLIISIPTQDARYVGCNYSIGYMMILILFCFIFKYKTEKNKNKLEQK